MACHKKTIGNGLWYVVQARGQEWEKEMGEGYGGVGVLGQGGVGVLREGGSGEAGQAHEEGGGLGLWRGCTDHSKVDN